MRRWCPSCVTRYPLHIIQRDNNRFVCFFAGEDDRRYLDTLEEMAEKFGCALHAYVLMTNHVHLLFTPNQARRAVPGKGGKLRTLR